LKVLWALLCQGAIVDKTTNNLSAFNIIEQVAVPVPPPDARLPEVVPVDAVPALFQFVILFGRSDPEVPELGRARLHAVKPDGIRAEPQEFEVDLQQFPRNRSMFRIPGIPATTAGDFLFLVDGLADDANWIELFRLPIAVVLDE
jgi:hypothetical protein